ncbi:hypothetical protein ACP70R_003883 [Stipagrostis hirtigluma subsp. patula]
MFENLMVAIGLPSSDDMPIPPPSSESAFVAEEVAGSHVLTVDGYSRIKRLVSSTFAAAGHRWSIRYYPGGNNGESEWISIYLRLDQTRAPDVKAQFTFSLLDLNGKPVCCKSSDWIHTFTCGVQKGFSQFIRKHSLHPHNDSVRIRCDITVLKEIRKEDYGGGASRFVVVPPPNMDQHLGHLLDCGEGADITFEVDGVAFKAHRNILAARSPVFEAELFGPMKGNNEAYVIIDDIEAKVFKAMLHFVYTDSLPEIDQGETMAMAQHLLVAADRFSLQRLKLMCEDTLCSYIDKNTVGTILALADQHVCHGLKKACFQFIMSGSNLKAAIVTDGFDHLTNSCPSVLKELLSKLAQ